MTGPVRERPNIAAMRGYTAGEQPEDGRTLKLNTNENPWPPSPAVTEALAAFDVAALRRYPPATASRFRAQAAQLHGLEPDQVIATRGGDELLRLVITTFVDPGEVIGLTDPTYSLYPVLADIQGCSVTRVPLDDDWLPPPDFAARMNAADARLVLLVNPGAPSGCLLPRAQVAAIAAELDGLLLLDEAYVDFIDPALGWNSTSLVNDHANLVILRTLSKGYSMAGLRFGYGLANPDLIAPMLGKTRDSYNLDAISQELACAALGDQAWAARSWQRVREERARVGDALSGLGFRFPPSETNFLLATLPPGARLDAEQLCAALKDRHVLVRYFDADRLRDKLRISIGTPDENKRLLGALTDALA